MCKNKTKISQHNVIIEIVYNRDVGERGLAFVNIYFIAFCKQFNLGNV